MKRSHTTASVALLAATLSLIASVACSSAAPTSAPAAPTSSSVTRNSASSSNPGGASSTTSGAAASNTKPAAAASPAAAVAPAAAPAQPSDSAASSPADQSAAPMDPRMVIYTTDLTLVATSLDDFQQRATTLVNGLNGYVSGIQTQQGTTPSVVVRLKVPPQHYDELMSGLRGLAVSVRDQKATTQDVTEDYDDTQTQISSLEAQEAQLLQLMQRASSVDDVLAIQRQADQVKLQLDRLKGHATALQRQSDYATISATAQLASAVLPRDFVAARSALRQAQANRAAIEAQLRKSPSAQDQQTLRDQLADAIVAENRQQAVLDDVQAQATAAGVALPQLSAADEAALSAGTPASSGFQLPASVTAAWTSSLSFLVAVLSVLVFFWWLLPLAVVALLVRRYVLGSRSGSRGLPPAAAV